MDPHLLATYLLAITVLTVTPGLDTLLVIRNTARGGLRDGAVSSLGICSGLFVHGAVSAVGISVILLQTAWAFSCLKLAGACYLVWLGASNWRDVLRRRSALAGSIEAARAGEFKALRSLKEGFLSNVLNPKTAVFYLAFLPQFIDPSRSALAQSLLLAGMHFAIAMLWQCLLALMVRQARQWLLRPAANRMFGALTGSVLIFLGLRLAAAR
ncbi:threonine transporter RhtB [Desulfuromonas versatilis]|uniref:Threonine transporter RhtB n=1 Tax=Desulfuromonas versatilis TaxID=2802975 RepID=A0ABM8HZS9_9BACT|nr:LysE family translocator [Desulfuromonas versatilis]BCR06153.1 threonine transporter RhtB [Desulfuromonas versatilis]